MMLWPYVLDLTIGPAEREKPLHLWLPLFLLWPLLAILALISFALTMLLDVVAFVIGQPYHRYTEFVYRCFALLGHARGTTVHINGDDARIDLTLY